MRTPPEIQEDINTHKTKITELEKEQAEAIAMQQVEIFCDGQCFYSKPCIVCGEIPMTSPRVAYHIYVGKDEKTMAVICASHIIGNK